MSKRNKSKVKELKREKKEASGKKRKEKFLTEEHIAPPVIAKNDKQKEFLKALKNKQVVVFNGPAGTGKSYITGSIASDWMKKGVYDKIVLSRPYVGMGKTMGSLPGSLREKFEPYMIPLVDVIKGRYGAGFYESSISNNTIEFAPLEFIRGRSFSDVVILDEAQNVTPEEMYTILTRVEEEGKLIIIGDPNQHDLRGKSGINFLVEFVNRNPELRQNIQIIEASSDDIVRSTLCKKVVKAKERYDISNKK
jgi:phosphate starvation-inducible PhoH-like protein